MSQSSTFEADLTDADIRALVASIYEREVRLWSGGEWCCPHCLSWNGGERTQCACGISRDGLPEFCERG